MPETAASVPLPDPLRRAARAVLSIAPALPLAQDIAPELEDARRAAERGYFLPDEDDRVRSAYARYLTARAALHRNLAELEPYVLGPRRLDGPLFMRAFAIAFCNACMLLRSARYLVDSYSFDPIIQAKLDEAEPRFGIPRKSFTRIYRSLCSTRNIVIFMTGVEIAREHKDELEVLADDSEMAPVIDQLRLEIPYIDANPASYVRRRLLYRLYSLIRRSRSGLRRISFALFQFSGSAIAELRNRWRRKRVTPRVRKRLQGLLRPGDVIITRHDDAVSNLFLPGFWPHAALYIGTAEERAALSVTGGPQDLACVLEARKDGVLYRTLEDTLGVDCCTVLRPSLSDDDRSRALVRALTHEGKLYDFEFDFTRSDKLACTEVVYRTFHRIGPIVFSLRERAGRFCLAAEDLLDDALDHGWFSIIAVYGVNRNRLVTGDRARETLIASYR